MDTGLVTDLSTGKIIPEYHVNWLYFKNDEEELMNRLKDLEFYNKSTLAA